MTEAIGIGPDFGATKERAPTRKETYQAMKDFVQIMSNKGIVYEGEALVWKDGDKERELVGAARMTKMASWYRKQEYTDEKERPSFVKIIEQETKRLNEEATVRVTEARGEGWLRRNWVKMKTFLVGFRKKKDEDKGTTDKKKGMSRRKFLRMATTTAVAAFGAGAVAEVLKAKDNIEKAANVVLAMEKYMNDMDREMEEAGGGDVLKEPKPTEVATETEVPTEGLTEAPTIDGVSYLSNSFHVLSLLNPTALFGGTKEAMATVTATEVSTEEPTATATATAVPTETAVPTKEPTATATVTETVAPTETEVPEKKNVFLESMRVVEEEREKRRKSDSEYEKRVDWELNRNRINFCLLGKDKEEGRDLGVYRSDAIVVASFDVVTKKMRVFTIPRDLHSPEVTDLAVKNYSREKCEGRSYRINAMTVFSEDLGDYGEILENATGLSMDFQVVIDHDSFIETLATVGDLKVEIDADFIKKYGPEFIEKYGDKGRFVPGENVLSPEVVLWYARVRKQDSDWKRQERQRQVVGAAVDSLKGMVKNPWEMAKMSLKLAGLIKGEKIKWGGLNADILFGFVTAVAEGGISEDNLKEIGMEAFDPCRGMVETNVVPYRQGGTGEGSIDRYQWHLRDQNLFQNQRNIGNR